jgi:multidrug efflux pump subunit AcrA (membrane-fusion protein)
VLKIGSLASRKRDPSGKYSRIKVFDVTVKVEEKDSRLKPGLTAAIDIIVDRREGVIAIPVGAVHSDKGQKFVFVSNRGKVENRKVVLGPSNENSVVVTQGLSPGELVILDYAPLQS